MKIETKQKHLTLDERVCIEQGLNINLSLKDIALKIKKDPTTISKEIKKHRIKKSASTYNGNNICSLSRTCTVRNACGMLCNNKLCKNCSFCNERCSNFTPLKCNRIFRFPYTCNGCPKKTSCRFEKYYYRALNSFNEYKTSLSESRQGISISQEDLANLDSIVSPLIKQGQSIAHIYHTQHIDCSKASLYNYIEKNYLSVGNLDLPRKVRFKLRKKHKEHKDTTIRKNRTYEDLQKYIENYPDISIVEMDTVEGIKGGKVLLTLFFRNCKLMLAFLLDNKTVECVSRIFDDMEILLGNDTFQQIFPVILTDNGSEFSNPLKLEFNSNGIGRTRIFYCNPSASYQKGGIEKNHEFIRYVIPKGTSLNNYTQEDINLMLNHINSLGRKSINWSNPYELSELLLGKGILKKLNLTKVPASEIKLTPKLLMKK